MPDLSPFVLGPRQKAAEVRSFAMAHHRALGWLRGTVGFVATLVRYVRLRVGIRGGSAPMVDDSVSMAVAMYRTLTPRLGADEGLRVVRDQVVASGAEMMENWLPEERSIVALGDQVRVVMGDAETRGIYRIEALSTTETGITLDVTSCRYAELTRQMGAPEVGQVFCAVDQPFVAGALPGLPFTCATTIARGDDRCRFRAGDEA